MKILLDIDGVMVPATNWKVSELGKDGFPNFSKKAVSGLNKIIADTDASVLLTTSHKSRYTPDVWERIFADRGINARISTMNNLGNFKSRKDEVLDWLLNSGNSEIFVILDDDKSLYDLPMEFKNSLVLISPLIGLNDDTANKAIDVLRNPH